ncbi:MAG TPA: ABC transporter substrate-binding protein [Chitinophagaceae bacterium]|nr:ABC transporter substrate-binding protein [Chitinophagaceae bacterium]
MISAVSHRQRLNGNSLIVLILFVFSFSIAQAQDSAMKRFQVAVFTPLYLDSAFDESSNYRYEKYFPKYINPGLEFYEGLQLAIDSLQKENANLDIFIYDLKSSAQPLLKIISDTAFNNIDLIIGNVNNTEMMLLANTAAQKKIPFINANFPNDGGITNNPYFVILNSTLKTHCEGIYKFVQKQFALADVVVFRKKGAQEDRLQSYFDAYTKTTASVPLKIKYVSLDGVFDSTALRPHLNKNRETICIAGSLDLTFAANLSQQLSSVSEDFNVKLIGMPNWDALQEINRPGLDALEVIYSSPFYVSNTNPVALGIQDHFKNKFYSRPSDMVYRGYETMYRFGKLLLQYGSSLNSSIGEKKYNIFSEFDIQPVFTQKQNPTLDYFENKKLYFVRKINGVLAGVN